MGGGLEGGSSGIERGVECYNKRNESNVVGLSVQPRFPSRKLKLWNLDVAGGKVLIRHDDVTAGKIDYLRGQSVSSNILVLVATPKRCTWTWAIKWAG